MLVVFHIFQTVGFYGFANWVPTLLVKQGITVTSSLLYTTVIGLAAPLGPLLGYWIADRFERKHVIVAMAALNIVSGLLFSQAATAQTLMPLGLTLGIAPAALVGMFPAVNGYFFIPTYGTLIAAVNFDRSGTTRIGKYVLNHSFMIPGLVSTIVAISTGLVIAKMFF